MHEEVGRVAGGAHRVLVEAGAVVDGERAGAAPGALLLEVSGAGVRVLACGDVARVRGVSGRTDRTIALPDHVVIPALVNAHTHLDLTHIGARPYDERGGFVGWIRMIRNERAVIEEAIRASVREGIARSIRGGVVALGDIAGAGSAVPMSELAASGLYGVSFVECFGSGSRQEEAIGRTREQVEARRAHETGRVRVGVQPHAPYSAGSALYRACAAMGVPVSTHLAESPEESRYVRGGDGPLRAFLEELGVWEEAMLGDVGRGLSPVASRAVALAGGRVLVAHANEASDDDLHILETADTVVAYCPRCSAYFGRERAFGAHRYRAMMGRGIPVALGTDSVVNLSEAGGQRLSPLDEMRLLIERDGLGSREALAMGTVNGARALRLDPALFTFSGGPVAGVLALEADAAVGGDAGAMLSAAIVRGATVRWIAGGALGS